MRSLRRYSWGREGSPEPEQLQAEPSAGQDHGTRLQGVRPRWRGPSGTQAGRRPQAYLGGPRTPLLLSPSLEQTAFACKKPPVPAETFAKQKQGACPQGPQPTPKSVTLRVARALAAGSPPSGGRPGSSQSRSGYPREATLGARRTQRLAKVEASDPLPSQRVRAEPGPAGAARRARR